MNTDEYKLEPIFDFNTCESSVLLNRGRAEICIDGNTYTGNGEVRLDLLPRGRLNYYGRFQGLPFDDAVMPITGQKKISSFSINGCQVQGFAVNIGGGETSQEMKVKWCASTEPVIGLGDESTQMIRIVFHLFNFTDLIGTQRSMKQIGTSMNAIEHVDLACDGWKVELKSLLSTRDNIKALKAEGGYRLTHVGSLEKADSIPFSGKDADDHLKALRFFLSFAKGGWCAPICVVGYDASGNRTWESWSSPKEPWHTPPSWFDPHNSSQMVVLFPGFMTRWANEDWSKALREVIYWYLNANHSSRGIDAGIILAQAAIERLSYEFVVKDRRLLTVNGFKDLWASDKFRLLFSSLGIPLDIPAETPELQNLATKGQMNWLDATHAITEIRNSLVHPEHKRHGQFVRGYYEAWNLSLWYLEMSILAICGYSGTYSNRLKQRWVGEVEDVPWKK
ncbi:hypothetical protein ACFLVM_01935 [Chloroflexota bacterium]